MSNKTRKALWPVALALAVVAIGAMALVMGFAGGSGTAQAHGPGSGHDANSCATDQAAGFHNLLNGNPPCLAAPTGVAGTPTNTSITLRWAEVTDAEEYIVERKTGSNAYGNATTVQTNTAMVSGLAVGTEYTFRVRATSAANGEGRWSADATVSTLSTTVASPTDVSASHGGQAGQVVVEWTELDDVDSYIVTYREVGATAITRDSTDAESPHTIDNLMAQTAYEVCVIAVVGTDQSAPACDIVTTSRYRLTFRVGTAPLQSDPQNIKVPTKSGATATVTATLWVPSTPAGERTDTVTIQFSSMDDTAKPPTYNGIDVDDPEQLKTLGLLAVSDADIGHGELTIRPRDNNKRSFNMEFACEMPATRVYVTVYDDQVDVVERGYVELSCGPPKPAPGETAGLECYSVTGVVDQGRDDLDLAENDSSRTLNSSAGARGIVRNADGTLDIRDRRGEVGQDTTEVLVNSANVQLIVTSCEPGPVYIRFLDENMNVFGTDVDEAPAHRGADVVGLDSQGKLELNITDKALTAAQALMYDQYSLVETSVSTTTWAQYLRGDAGTYYQGKFRFFDPCPAAGDHFYVEVYEKYGKDIRELENGMTREKVTCVPPLQPGANELQVSFDTADVTDDNTGTAVVTWEAIDNATVYTVAVINTTNAARYTIHGTPATVRVVTGDPEANRMARFPGIVSGTRYIFAVYAQVTGGTYSALRSVILTPEFVAN